MRRFKGDVAAPRRYAPLVALAVLATASGVAAAQEPDNVAPSVEEHLPRYTVELIVFTYEEGASGASEIFVPEVPPGGYAALEEEPRGQAVFSDRPPEPLSAPVPGEAPAPGDEAAAPDDEAAPPYSIGDPEITGIDENLADIPLRARIELQRLPPEQYSMNEIYEKLVDLDAYRPIMHAAWTQTTPPEDASPAIRLRALGDPPPGLAGTVKLYQGRFVHLGLDVALDAGRAETLEAAGYDAGRSATDRAIAGSGLADDPAAPGPAWGDSTFGPYGDSLSLPVRYRISEVRIIRNGDTRYYDHPRFGVIAKLTKIEQEPPEPAEDTDPFTAGD